MEYRQEREAVLAAACRTVASGLTHGTAGNVSMRIPPGMLITPTGLEYDRLTPEEVVATGLDGVPLPGERWAPSSEWPLHAAVYAARPEIGAVVHGHAPAASAFSCLGRDLPPFHYMIAAAGGDSIRCAEYALFGTPELAAQALRALTDRRACFLARHGLLALGTDLPAALALAVEVEHLADLFLRLLPLGEPARLSDAEMAAVLARFATYGQQPKS